MLGRKSSIALSTFILSLSLCLGAASAQAASECKGSAKGACESRDDCSWVKGYKRKDGIEVASHCKSKPKKSGKSEEKKKSGDKKKSDTKK